MTVDQRIQNLEDRINYQEYLHRYHDSNGWVKHTLSDIPLIILAFVIGSAMSYVYFGNISKPKKSLIAAGCIICLIVYFGLTLGGESHIARIKAEKVTKNSDGSYTVSPSPKEKEKVCHQ